MSGMKTLTLTITIEIEGSYITAALADADELYQLDPRTRLAILRQAIKALSEEHEHAKIAAYLAAASKPRRARR